MKPFKQNRNKLLVREVYYFGSSQLLQSNESAKMYCVLML